MDGAWQCPWWVHFRGADQIQFCHSRERVARLTVETTVVVPVRTAWTTENWTRSTLMPETTAPYGRKTQREPAVKEIHIIWITAGLSCDGDSVSITAATQPSIEDV